VIGVGLGAAWFGCEVVLGELPPVGVHPDAGAGGAGGTGGAGSSGSSVAATTGVGGSGGGAGTGGACCDCDGDGFIASGMCDAGADADCDDADKLVHPGEPTYYPMMHPKVGWDWDCNGKPDPNPAFTATVKCAGAPVPCPSATGYLGTVYPPCGGNAPWGTCKPNSLNLGCVNEVIDTAKVMTCK
jgi:hypothetical protein